MAQRVAILALVCCGGVAALSWEAVWQLRATLAIGVSAFGTAVTLAGTMSGMSLGAALAGRLLAERAVARPMRLYGALEASIGVLGLLLPFLFAQLERLDTWIYAASPASAPVVQVLGILVVIGPPSMAMGASVPAFALIARAHSLSLAALYALNTAGAALGVLAFSFVLLPAFGMHRTGVLAASINGLVFLLAAAVRDRAPTSERTVHDLARRAPASGLSWRLACAMVFTTGFVTFGLEVAWFRSLRAAFESTTESFAVMLASVLVALALGARLAPWLRRRGVTPAALLACAGCTILLMTPLVERVDLVAVGSGSSYLALMLRRTLVAFGTLGPAMSCLGAVLPWCLEEFDRPARVGRLYAINTVGAIFGSLIAAWALLPTFGFARTAWILGAGVVLTAAATAPLRTRWTAAMAGAASLLVALAATASVGRDRIQVHDGRREHVIVDYAETPDSTISVIDDLEGGRMLVIDGFVATSLRRESGYMEWMGRLPMLLHERPDRALVICFGTGQTASAVRDEGVRELDLVEVNGVVFDMAWHFGTRSVLEDPRVRPIVMDGRAWIRRETAKYDVVTLEPMPPYHAGVNALYSREFYELVAQKLPPGGIVAQWLPIHLLSPYYAASIAATFQAVFPDAALWLAPGSNTGILVGRQGGRDEPIGTTWPGLATRRERSLPGPEIRAALHLDARALARYARIGDIVTDDNQLLAYSLASGERFHHGGPKLARANLDRMRDARARARRP